MMMSSLWLQWCALCWVNEGAHCLQLWPVVTPYAMLLSTCHVTSRDNSVVLTKLWVQHTPVSDQSNTSSAPLLSTVSKVTVTWQGLTEQGSALGAVTSTSSQAPPQYNLKIQISQGLDGIYWCPVLIQAVSLTRMRSLACTLLLK